MAKQILPPFSKEYSETNNVMVFVTGYSLTPPDTTFCAEIFLKKNFRNTHMCVLLRKKWCQVCQKSVFE